MTALTENNRGVPAILVKLHKCAPLHHGRHHALDKQNTKIKYKLAHFGPISVDSRNDVVSFCCVLQIHALSNQASTISPGAGRPTSKIS